MVARAADSDAVLTHETLVRITLFVTCLTDTLFPATAIATERVLGRLGHQVDFPGDQTCCGQMHVNSGYAQEAQALVRRMIGVFSDAEVVVCPSASCTAMVRHHYPAIAARAGDPKLVHRARELASKTFELSELLVDVLGVQDVGARFPHRVAYHPSCHGLRMLRLADKPRRLLQSVDGLDLLDLADAEECCGFGGTFAIKNSAVSEAMMADKLERLRSSGAEFCVATDNSCLMHLAGGLTREHSKIRPLHLAEVLATTT